MVRMLAARTHKPALILCPSAATMVWKTEMSKNFPVLTPRYFIGRRTVGTLDMRELTLEPTVVDLLEFLLSVPHEAATRNIVTLSSYTTWSARTLYWAPEYQQKVVNGKGKAPREEEDEDDGEILTEEQKMLIRSHVDGVFARVVADEAQKLKHERTRAHLAVSKLWVAFVNMFTAMPRINKPADLKGLLTLLWSDSYAEHWTDDTLEDGDRPIEAYDEAKAHICNANKLEAADLRQYSCAGQTQTDSCQGRGSIRWLTCSLKEETIYENFTWSRQASPSL